MSEIFDTLETGEHCLLKIPELDYPLILPWVWLLGEEQDTQIASLNLIGKIGWNQDLGRLIAQRIRQTLPNLEGLLFRHHCRESTAIGSGRGFRIECEGHGHCL
ncbi:MAG: hypothetical protein H6Q41_3659 [Deltaproteobacteria bacterium]|nr:hypothetical protein [Deltaproteobacteria bacterium]